VTPPTPDTWAAVYPIFQAKCESAFCHGPSEIAPQLFGDEATVRPLAEARVDSIAMRTAVDSPRPMPPAGMGLDLTEAEHAAITAWAESL
jgi:cytochrome c5